eukprot:4459866-Prymnesium_polylepis.2
MEEGEAMAKEAVTAWWRWRPSTIAAELLVELVLGCSHTGLEGALVHLDRREERVGGFAGPCLGPKGCTPSRRDSRSCPRAGGGTPSA